MKHTNNKPTKAMNTKVVYEIILVSKNLNKENNVTSTYDTMELMEKCFNTLRDLEENKEWLLKDYYLHITLYKREIRENSYELLTVIKEIK